MLVNFYKSTWMAAAALWELTRLILINQFKLTGLQKNRDAAANFGFSLNLTGFTVTMEINQISIIES